MDGVVVVAAAAGALQLRSSTQRVSRFISSSIYSGPFPHLAPMDQPHFWVSIPLGGVSYSTRPESCQISIPKPCMMAK